jgi:hypothetical protein
MPQPIRDVLNRRTDLSTFVVHLTRDRDELQEPITAREALESIVEERYLRAETPMGMAKDQDDASDPAKQTQRVVCFSETPLEHIYSLVADIEGRRVWLRPYGLAMTKLTARRMGIGPIWYVNQTTGFDWEVTPAVNELNERAVREGNFHEDPIAKLTPFLEQMGTWSEGSRKEFWWEREWRHVGPLWLPSRGVIWLCPEADMGTFREKVGEAPLIDPTWGLEQIIAHLAGFEAKEWTPFEPK